ncbi:MAG: hypothetical protein SGILL_003558 [Bacillariaceae sp.]
MKFVSLAVSAAAIVGSTDAAVFKPFAIQSGGGNHDNSGSLSSAFGVSQVYNENSYEVAITGGVFGSLGPSQGDDGSGDLSSSCFVTVLRIPHVDPAGKVTLHASWVRRRQYGNDGANEFCSDLIWKPHDFEETEQEKEFDTILPGEFISVGHSAEKGLMTSLLPPGNDRRQMYGMALGFDSSVNLQGGGLFHSNEIQLPVAIARNPMDDTLFVAEMFSDDKKDVSVLESLASTATEKYGQDLSAKGFTPSSREESFSVRIRMIEKQLQDDNDGSGGAEGTAAEQIQEIFEEGYIREYGTEGLENVRVTSMRFAPPDKLLMTGYTAGSSEAFGEANSENPGDIDGFLAVLDANTGDVISVLRIESDYDEPGNDFLNQLCFREGSNEYDQEMIYEVYVVGTKELEDTSTSYTTLRKVMLDTMTVLWTRKVEGFVSPDATDEDGGAKIEGLACAVTNDGKDVYLGGNVKGGSMLPERRRKLLSCETDNDEGDIFISKYSDVGEMKFTREIGSRGRDTLATGKSLSTDAEGNLIVLANTDGSLYRPKAPNGSSDIAVFSVGRELGDFVVPPDFNEECRDSHLDGGKAVSGSSSSPNTSMWASVTIAALAMFTLMALGTAGLLVKRRNAKKQIFCKGTNFSKFNSNLVQYDGIWRAPTVPSDGVVLMGRGEASRDPYFSENGSGSFSSTFSDKKPPPGRESAHKFPLGAYSDSASGKGETEVGDVYDLLEMASRRYSRVLEDDNTPSRGRLADAIKSVTSSPKENDEVEDIVGAFEEDEE